MGLKLMNQQIDGTARQICTQMHHRSLYSFLCFTAY